MSWAGNPNDYNNHIVAYYTGWNYYELRPYIVASSSIDKGDGYSQVHYAYNFGEFLPLMEEYAKPYKLTLRYPPSASKMQIRRIEMADVIEIKRLITTENFVFNGMTVAESLDRLEEYTKRLYCQ